MANDDKGKAKDLLDWLGARALPDFTKGRWIGAGVGVLLAGLFALALLAAGLVLIHTIGQAMNPATEGPNLGAGALIAALLGAPFVIWGTWLKYQTVRYQKEGHITDRINTAVEQLGAEKTVKLRSFDPEGKITTSEETHPNIEVRIGAILSLERIAQDSTIHDKGRDHVRVMEILCAYVRENSNARKPVDLPAPDWELLVDNATAEARANHEAARKERFGRFTHESQAWIWAKDLTKPRADVMQALKVIGRRTKEQRRVEAAWPDEPDEATVWPFDVPCPNLPDEPGAVAPTPLSLAAFQRIVTWRDAVRDYKGYQLDLTCANLQAARLSPKRPDKSDAVFAGSLLQGTRLEGADLFGVRLEGANFLEARLEGVSLIRARLEGAILSRARLEGADLLEARLEGANLDQTRLEGADLFGVRLEGANFSEARSEGANLFCARLRGTNFEGARLERANLGGARLEGANLERTHLEEASLKAARLDGANLKRARLEGANLERARLEGADLSRALVDAATNWNAALLRQAAVRFFDFSATSISADQVEASFGDGSTTVPDGMRRPEHWPEAELAWGEFRDEWDKWRADPAGYRPPKLERVGNGD